MSHDNAKRLRHHSAPALTGGAFCYSEVGMDRDELMEKLFDVVRDAANEDIPPDVICGALESVSDMTWAAFSKHVRDIAEARAVN